MKTNKRISIQISSLRSFRKQVIQEVQAKNMMEQLLQKSIDKGCATALLPKGPSINSLTDDGNFILN